MRVQQCSRYQAQDELERIREERNANPPELGLQALLNGGQDNQEGAEQ